MRSLSYLILSLLLPVAAPTSAYALSCMVPANKVIMLCSSGRCSTGFRVYYRQTGFPCETRPVVEHAEPEHSSLLRNMFELADISHPDGVCELNFISCTREAVQEIPWSELAEQAMDPKATVANDSPWQLHAEQDRITILGRATGCAISLERAPVGLDEAALVSLRQRLSWEARMLAIENFARLWLLPLLLVPLLAAATGILILKSLPRLADEPREAPRLLLAGGVQVTCFLLVIGPATDHWMGQYRLPFVLSAGLIFILWLIELLIGWKAFSDAIDARQQSDSTAEKSTDGGQDLG
ncbi:MAG: hypothetical protein KDD69_09270 [Bdellovibrionales bacterium]|nr:hypothetical protein [Bdellovibrionales bacterium]